MIASTIYLLFSTDEYKLRWVVSDSTALGVSGFDEVNSMSYEDFYLPLCNDSSQAYIVKSLEVSIPKEFKFEAVYYNYT
jgi:hypothetical protein